MTSFTNKMRTSLLGLALALTPCLAWGQYLVFDTEIVSLNLTGSATLPLGPAGADILADITLTRATDHNSSRSNKTSNTPSAPDDIDPDEEDGNLFSLVSLIDLEFDLGFTDNDPGVDFAQGLGASPSANTDGSALLELDLGSTFVFDASEPDFNMLKAAGPPKKKYRGHVTVLKIAFGGGGGDIDIAADGMEFEILPGSDVYKTLANGDLEHTVGVAVNLVGTYGGNPFQISGLTGTMVEQGQLANSLVPEPSSVVLALLAGLACMTRRRASNFLNV
jgi:hypothetical protein